MSRFYSDWGRVEDGGLMFCPNPLGCIANPSEEVRRRAGYKPIERTEKPAPQPNGSWKEELADEAGWIRLVWKWEADPVDGTVEVVDEGQYLTEGDYDAAMEHHLLTERCERGYTTREPTQYINSGVPRFRQDARDWVAHVDAVMLYSLDVLNACRTENKVPSLEEFRAGLPRIVWTYKEA